MLEGSLKVITVSDYALFLLYKKRRHLSTERIIKERQGIGFWGMCLF